MVAKRGFPCLNFGCSYPSPRLDDAKLHMQGLYFSVSTDILHINATACCRLQAVLVYSNLYTVYTYNMSAYSVTQTTSSMLATLHTFTQLSFSQAFLAVMG